MKFEDLKVGDMVYRVEGPRSDNNEVRVRSRSVISVSDDGIVLNMPFLGIPGVDLDSPRGYVLPVVVFGRYVHGTERAALHAFSEEHLVKYAEAKRSMEYHSRLASFAISQISALDASPEVQS